MIHRLATIAAAVAGINLATPALALEVPVGLEGRIDSISPATDTIVVMGITVSVPPTATITTPTADINSLAVELGTAVGQPDLKPLTLLDQLNVGGVDVLPPYLPGRNLPGFVGATAIVAGSAVLDAVTGAVISVTATSVSALPAENLILGGITSVNCSTVRCDAPGDSLTNLGRALLPIDDPRMPALPVLDDFGFAINLAQLAGPLPSSVEGYYGDDQVLHYHTMTIDVGTSGTALLNQGPEIAVSLATCRDRGDKLEFEFRGATHDPSSGTVDFIDPTTGLTIGNVKVDTVFDEITGLATRYGNFRFRKTINDSFGGCPDSVQATFVDGGGVATVSPMSIQ